MTRIQRTPVDAGTDERGDIAVKFDPDTIFPVSALEAMFILPMPYEAFRRKYGLRAPESFQAFKKECLAATDLVKVVELLLAMPGVNRAEERDEPLEPEA